ncbi:MULTISPECIES: hypothetical protein [Bacillus cereus group]|uniref:hypothetical protein n=1 Tax=Bacillus cereus group TaxID=86661 RepID=UPI000BFD73D8|nr:MULTISPECIES: hypothetical protein [Bacillus cereus group]MCR6788085.1 hypothetical protein [Bacillus thuringiensis]MCR6822229.1 hypothetical protein [Bacillus thuringiensis]MCR6830161.1 hypothetical protein [Bacillus thuringiensis]MEB8929359.1 hypothetical protein [Bacillus cereus]MEB9327617.1 hypothetical protein [Bacillus cereus]
MNNEKKTLRILQYVFVSVVVIALISVLVIGVSIVSVVVGAFVIFGITGAILTHKQPELKATYKNIPVDERDALIRVEVGNIVSRIFFWVFIALAVIFLVVWFIYRIKIYLWMSVLFDVLFLLHLVITIILYIRLDKKI